MSILNKMTQRLDAKNSIWIAFLVLTCLVFQIGGLAARGLNNWASIVLLRESSQHYISHCVPRMEHSVAVPFLEMALQCSSNYQRVWLNLGRAAWLKGQCQQAVDFWQRAVELSPKDQIALWQLANALYSIGETEQALKFYRLTKAEGFFYHLARRAQQENDQTRVFENYKIGISIAPNPDRSDYWWAVGQISEITKDWHTALYAYVRAIPLEKNDYRLYEIYMRAGVVAQRQKDYLTAAKYFESAIETHPQSVWGYLSRGNLEQVQLQYLQAIEWYQRAERIDPKSEWPLYYQGVLYWEMGRKDQARTLFIAAEKRNPQNPSVQFYLGLDAYGRNDLDEAINYLHQAIALYSAPPKYWVQLLGDWQAQARYCTQSVATYQQLLVKYPDDSNIRQRLKTVSETCR